MTDEELDRERDALWLQIATAGTGVFPFLYCEQCTDKPPQIPSPNVSLESFGRCRHCDGYDTSLEIFSV